MVQIIKSLILVFTLFTSLNIYSSTKEWNVVIYLSSDNNLSSYMENVLKRIQNIKIDNSINVFVMYDGNKVNDSKLIYFNGNKESILEEEVEYDMGDPKTLARLVKLSKKYQAKKMALLLYAHGRGILNVDANDGSFKGSNDKAFSPDDSQRSYFVDQDMAYQLEEVLGEKKIDLLVYNSCLMGNLEIILTMSSIAKFAIASEYKIVLNPKNEVSDDKATGISFSKLVDNLSINPSLGPLEIGKKTVSQFEKSYKDFTIFMDRRNPKARFESTAALYDLSKSLELAKKFHNFSKKFQLLLDDFDNVQKIYFESLLTEKINSLNYLDVGEFLKTIYPSLGDRDAFELYQFISHQFVIKRAILNIENSDDTLGLSIFFPMSQIAPMHIVNSEAFYFYQKQKVVEYLDWATVIKKYNTLIDKNFHLLIFEGVKGYLKSGEIVKFNHKNSREENIEHLFRLFNISLGFIDLKIEVEFVKEYLKTVIENFNQFKETKYPRKSLEMILERFDIFDSETRDYN